MTGAAFPPAGLPEALRPAALALDRRLDPGTRAPLALGFSGGSDSLALLLLALRWVAPRGRRVLALTVNHGLHPAGVDWTRAAGEVALRLGADWRALPWLGPKPAAGLPAAARRARHALLAAAARDAGTRVLLLGHTLDDAAESELIRQETPAHGRLAEWTPSPAWPEGRDVFLLRPWLDASRAPLRAWLASEGLAWLDDPANADPRFGRTRARQALAARALSEGASEPPPRPSSAAPEAPPALALPFQGEGWGGLRLPVRAVLGSPRPADVLARALLCVGGGDRPPSGAGVQRRVEAMRAGTFASATLCGTRLAAAGATVLLTREAGRGGAAPQALAPGKATVFDGRFEVTAHEPGWRVVRLAGHAAGLSWREREALHAVPAEARPSLPVLLAPSDRPKLLLPSAGGPATAHDLVAGRFRAALGEVGNEAEAAATACRNPSGGTRAVILS